MRRESSPPDCFLILLTQMARGFIYLAAVVGWFTRRVLAWRVSITLEADFCVETLKEALARQGMPEIFDTDQGSQFTSTDFIKLLASHQIKISMDGKNPWRDNAFVERLWQTIKYEEVCVRVYDSLSEARAGIGRYLDFYNSRHPHSTRRENPRSGLLQPADARSGGGVTKAENHLVRPE